MGGDYLRPRVAQGFGETAMRCHETTKVKKAVSNNGYALRFAAEKMRLATYTDLSGLPVRENNTTTINHFQKVFHLMRHQTSNGWHIR